MTGQMGLEGRIGRRLREIAGDPEVSRCLEIGTWHGEGSTVCIGTALRETGGTLVSVEADTERHERAVAFHARLGLPVELVCGLSIRPDEYEPFESYLPLVARTDYEREEPGAHLGRCLRETGMAAGAARTDVLRWLLERDGGYDLVLFDGGDFAGAAEFAILEPYVRRWVVLDDTNPVMAIKNVRNREWLLAGADWVVVDDELDDRCGWLSARRLRPAEGRPRR